ncbi:LysM peptidoglycan-binding domain-containing protein [Eisenibacter elegans]|uniref:LysM peptidoglycan-binding domain-containing protein n=1 Tax=Eisenibacter elegans TaxID=997 RepID=UPI000479015E|nr:LysM peptidoglycan-binding domain-containing protein [Eisenibacter elegans]
MKHIFYPLLNPKKRVALLYLRLALTCICLVFSGFELEATPEEVPSILYFGGMRIIIDKGAQKQIQQEINTIYRNQAVHEHHIKLAQDYFPLLSELLRKRGLPDEFKYYIVMGNPAATKEGGLWRIAADAANGTYKLQISAEVDERLEPVLATQAVADVLARHNLLFKNWMFTLLSLEYGLAEARKYAKEAYGRDIQGAKELRINENSHSYFKRFLAYMLVYQEVRPANTQLMVYEKGARKNLHQLAKELHVDEGVLKAYNPWLLGNRVPYDKTYHVVIPIAFAAPQQPESVKAIALVDAQVEEQHWSSSQNLFVEQPTQVWQNNMSENKAAINDIEYSETQNTGNRTQETTLFIDHLEVASDQLEINAFGLDGQPLKVITRTESATNPNNTQPNNTQIHQNTTQQNHYDPSHTLTHIVKPGETLAAISRHYGVSMQQLQTQNQLHNPNNLKVGQRILVADPGSISYTAHLIQPRETLYGIARYYQVSMAQIKNWNKLTSDMLQAGQTILIMIDNRKDQPAYRGEGNFYERQRRSPGMTTPANLQKKSSEN